MEILLTNRGPDSFESVHKNGVFFHGAVLWQQGPEPCIQPVTSDNEVLLFNGDLYMDSINHKEISDTEFLFNLLSIAQNEQDVLDIFQSLTGPFSVVFLFNKTLFFGRDSLGRNSLLFGKHKDSLFISSIIDKAGEDVLAIELPPLGIYKVVVGSLEVELYPYNDIKHEHHFSQLEKLKEIVQVNVRHKIMPKWLKETGNCPKFSFDDLHDDFNFECLLRNEHINETCEIFISLLTKSVKDRVERTPKMCRDCVEIRKEQCNHCRIGLLFSGGVDCSMIAILAEKFIDPHIPIDLLNVSFEKVSHNKKIEEINWNVPDRLTGLETLGELKTLRPNRKWNFNEINITREELGRHAEKLSSLVYPLNNVLDESLGAALYFASRGKGTVDGRPYNSTSRVLLIGSGADELFGGYTRHRNAFKRSTPDQDLLAEELKLDWVRLPSRNLARDDRVIADNSITVRAPFIEENFVQFATSLKPLQRCFPALPEGVGEKLLLRLCAYKLGLKYSSRLKKRALQFGSRIADKRQSAKDPSILLAMK